MLFSFGSVFCGTLFMCGGAQTVAFQAIALCGWERQHAARGGKKVCRKKHLGRAWAGFGLPKYLKKSAKHFLFIGVFLENILLSVITKQGKYDRSRVGSFANRLEGT